MGLHAIGTLHLIHSKTKGHGAALTNFLFGFLNQLPDEAHAIFQRAAIFVHPLIELREEKMMGDGHVMSGVGINNIKTRGLGPSRRLPVPATQFLDIRFIHLRRLTRRDEIKAHIHRRQRTRPRQQICGVITVMGQFNRSQCAMGVNSICDQSVGRNITIIPQPVFGIGR